MAIKLFATDISSETGVFVFSFARYWRHLCLFGRVCEQIALGLTFLTILGSVIWVMYTQFFLTGSSFERAMSMALIASAISTIWLIVRRGVEWLFARLFD